MAHRIAHIRHHFNFATGCMAQILNFSANGLKELESYNGLMVMVFTGTKVEKEMMHLFQS